MARDVQGWMWAEALELLDQAERMHRAFFRPGPGGHGGASWEPPVDLFETEREVWVQVALPGVLPEQLRLGMDRETLIVAGERPLSLPRGAGVIHRLEMPHGSFERRIALPPGRYELARRELAQGCLTLILRKLA